MEPAVKLPPNAFYEWTYNDGFIHLKANKKLVIGVQQNDEVRYIGIFTGGQLCLVFV